MLRVFLLYLAGVLASVVFSSIGLARCEVFSRHSFLLLFTKCLLVTGRNYEGLEVLSRLAHRIQSSEGCRDVASGHLYPHNLPTKKTDDDDLLSWLLQRNESVIIFDFENPGLGIGNGLAGFLQAIDWAMLGGLPLFLLEPEGESSVNSLCFIFECGFPLVRREYIFGAGARLRHLVHVFPPTPTARQYHSLLAYPEKLLKIVSFKSNGRLNACTQSAFYNGIKPCGKQNAGDASVCWQSSILQGLLPRLSKAAVERLAEMESQFHGDFRRILELARDETMQTESKPIFFKSLHVRTLLPRIETYRWLQGPEVAAKFKEGLNDYINRSDLCTFQNEVSSDRAPIGAEKHDIFIASDSLEFKNLLTARWENSDSSKWRLHFFRSPGERLES